MIKKPKNNPIYPILFTKNCIYTPAEADKMLKEKKGEEEKAP